MIRRKFKGLSSALVNVLGRKQRSWVPCALAILFVLAATCIASAQEQPIDEEYRVYEAVLKLMDTIPKEDPHVEIYQHTLTSRCALADNTPIFAKGCSFFWVKPDTDEDVERNLRARFHGLSHSTWKSFKANNVASITLHDPIAAPWKHKFVGLYQESSTPTTAAQEAPEPAEFCDEWASPDMTIYFSRVGFDKKKTEALVYVLVFAYADRAATTGDYLRFRLAADKQWTLAGRVSYLKQDSSLTASFSPTQIKGALGPPALLPAAEWK